MHSVPHSPDVVSEAEIQAFVDGLLAPDRAARIQRYLHERPDEARRVAFYGTLNWRMHSSFQEADDSGRSPLSLRALHVASLAGWWRQRVRRMAVIALLLVAAAAGALCALRVPRAALEATAVMALEQAIASHTPADAPRDALLLAAAPDLSRVGFRAIAVATLPVGPFAQARGFVYCNAAGERAVLLSVRDLTASAQPQWQARRVGESRVLEWSTGHMRYVLAGRANARGLMRAADLLAAR
ncbi:anti-sigma factor family protein [Paraburkholderia sp. GAS42]|jgi:anti-sigma factor RsiW|uniref:anti-sigma factor family protein n=1 Tax=Paraburkholderia sp. GAS42 TaxID=3035135 RepID=UPI003D1DBBBA